MALLLFESFAKSSIFSDGLKYTCKTCDSSQRKSALLKLKKNTEKYNEFSDKEKERAAAYRSEKININYNNSKSVKKYRNKFKEKVAAHNKVAKSIMNGSLIKLPCQICGNEKSNAHHEDYSKPLDIIWLCRKHHEEIHHRSNEQIRKQLNLDN